MHESEYQESIDSMVWSYSRIGCYEMCPYKFFMTYIADDESEKQDKFYATYGSFMHKLIEKYYTGELKKEDMVSEFLTGFSENVKGVGPNENIVRKYIKAGINYLTSFKPFPYNMIAVEKRVEVKINGHNFIGYIDFLGEKDGELYIVDNKSRDLKPRSNRNKPTKDDSTLDDMLRQLYIYAEAVKQEYGKYPKALCFNCFKSGVFIEEPFKTEKLEETINHIETMIEIIRNEEEFPPNPEFFKCRYLCDLSHECVFA